jgi:hypothetical protein
MAKHSRRSVLAPRCLSPLQLRHHRITELTPTLKISAASRRDAPLSTASTARSRKSVEYGLGMDLAPRANQFLERLVNKLDTFTDEQRVSTPLQVTLGSGFGRFGRVSREGTEH